jgi:hypothetical protein
MTSEYAAACGGWLSSLANGRPNEIEIIIPAPKP